MNQLNVKRRASIDDVSFDFDEINNKSFDSMGSLTDNEMEFLRMKRTRALRMKTRYYSPDPRLGDYEA